MEAKDLRKGNIVKNDKLDIFKKGYIILEARDIYNLAVFESGQTVDEEHKCFYPIFIDEDTIKMFTDNFDISPSNKDILVLKKERILTFNIETGFICICGHPIRHINTIHQLQNICFALTGSELVFST